MTSSRLGRMFFFKTEPVAMPKPDFEKLGVFYLGRQCDVAGGPGDGPSVLYDSKDLVTHAVCVGMTGSGKTGLCVGLIEEAALDGIPVLAIDPKGDLGNLLLTFPNLALEDFRPWIQEDQAAAQGVSPDELARREAERWRSGLARWGEDGERIERLRRAADFVIYTPGSTAGLPLSLLKSFDPPPAALRSDAESFQDAVVTTVTGLLALIGLQADPVRSREHILLSTLLAEAWKAGASLDLDALIRRVQTPPISRVGVLEIDVFYPPADRFQLAMRLNHLLASPSFESWREGEPLDVSRLLHTPEGKPRVSILSIAHLDDAQRMFFVSSLLNQVIGWMRNQTGTTSLRAIVYMDEVAGYLPPGANPPSKRPLLLLLKQARAFGLGVVLATQNPVDLDYKALSNAGTWFLGRLQTERDKARVLDGLEGVAASAGGAFDRAGVGRTLSGLGKRIFLLHDVHEPAPILFESRWTMSYLRGPLTREQLRMLMAPRRAAGSARAVPASPFPPEPEGAGAERAITTAPPLLPPDVRQFFLPARANGRHPVAWRPRLFVAAQVHFENAKLKVDVSRDVAFVAPLDGGPSGLRWDEAVQSSCATGELETEPPPSGRFQPLPAAAERKKSYDAWAKEFASWLARTQTLELFASPALGFMSSPGESERDFQVRLQLARREARDRAVERLRERYAAKLAAQTERVRRAEQVERREKEQASQQKLQTAVSFGVTLLDALMGRKAVSRSTLGRASTAARGVGRSVKEAQDVARVHQNLELEQQKLAQIESDLAAAIAEIDAAQTATDTLERITVKPKRSDIHVQNVSLAWEAIG